MDVDGSKTEYMVRFLNAEGYDYAVLLDDDDAEDAKSHKETLVEKGVDEDSIVLVSDVLDGVDEETPVEIEDLLPAEIFCEVVAEKYPDDVDPDDLVQATGDEYRTIPEAVKAKLQEIEQGELQEGGFDKGDIAETICGRVASGEYDEEKIGEESLEAFGVLIEELSDVLPESE
nr:hypothetical protein [Halorussus salinus]